MAVTLQSMDPSEIEFQINIIRKIRESRLDYDNPLTLMDLKHYRLQLYQKVDRTDTENQELAYLTKLIRFNDRPYMPPSEIKKMKQVNLSIGVTTELFEYLLPKFCSIINNEDEWVCLHHVMIYRGWMVPVDFYPWVDWLNERLRAIGRNDVLHDSARRKISKYLSRPERYLWVLEDYLKAENKTSHQSDKKFRRHCDLCDQIDEIFDGVRDDDKMILASGITTMMVS